MTCLLKVKSLRIQIDAQEGLVEPVRGIDFSIEKGAIFALVGESGSGKTMTGLAINRLLPSNASLCEGSEIWLEDCPIHQRAESQMRGIRTNEIGMIFQDPNAALNPVFTIGEQLFECLKLKKMPRESLLKEALFLLEQVNIPDPQHCLNQYPHQLSGGMKQRVVIAMALSKKPKLLIADEPTTALDVTTQAQVLSLIKSLSHQYDMTILMVTHDFGVVSQMADHVAVMHNGRIVEMNATEHFFVSPINPYTKSLLKASSLIENHSMVQHDEQAPLVLSVEDLKVHFPIRKGLFKRTVGFVKAVDGVSFNLVEGQTLAIVGESGSGKTTVGKAILRLVQATSGSIQFLNHSLLTLSAHALWKLRSEFQMVFQDPFSSMDPRMHIGDILEEGMVALKIGSDDEERHERIKVLLEQVDLPSTLVNRYPHELSGGQKQRIAIARALSVGAQLIVCDEPTSALDVSVQAQVLKLLKSLQEELHISLLFITHNMAVVRYMADRVVVMQNGRVVETGTASEVLHSPSHPYTQTLMRSVPHNVFELEQKQL